MYIDFQRNIQKSLNSTSKTNDWYKGRNSIIGTYNKNLLLTLRHSQKWELYYL